MAVYILLLAVISFTPPETAQGQECGTGNFPRREQFLLNKTIDYQLPNGDLSIGYLFIAPQLKFDCHGTITRWYALTNFNTEDAALDVLFHYITFQLWRPSAEDNRMYSFVGSNIAKFNGSEIRAGRTILDDGTQFSNLTSIPPAQERLQFQPGDVIGWYIHTAVQAIEQPLSIVYRYATSDNENHAVDMFSTVISDSDHADTPPLCDVAIYSVDTTFIPSVIPYITVEYETLSDPPETGRIDPPLQCVNNSPPLYLTTTTESTPPDQTQSITNSETVTIIKPSTPPNSITNSETVSPQSKGIGVPIAIAVIVVMVILLIGLISSGVPVLLMVYQRSRNSTTQNTGIMTIDLMAHNEGAGPLSGRQQNPYEFS